MMMLEELTLERLVKAKERISKPENWTKSEGFALNQGVPRYCAVYAVGWSGKGLTEDNLVQTRAIETLRKQLPNQQEGALMAFNDHQDTTHEMMMDLFDRAIQSLTPLKEDPL